MSGDTSRAALKIETEGSALVRVAENWVSSGALELDVDDERDVTRSERNTLFTFYASAAAESNTSLAARRDGRLCIFDHAVDSAAPVGVASEASETSWREWSPSITHGPRIATR